MVGGWSAVSRPPVEHEEVTNASAVLLTHDHVDHTDPETLLPLASASPQARLVCPFTSRDTLVDAGVDRDRITVPEIGEPLEVAGASVTTVPSAHTDLERDPGARLPVPGVRDRVERRHALPRGRHRDL